MSRYDDTKCPICGHPWFDDEKRPCHPDTCVGHRYRPAKPVERPCDAVKANLEAVGATR
jgi:hypothetical protein